VSWKHVHVGWLAGWLAGMLQQQMMGVHCHFNWDDPRIAASRFK